MTRTVQAAFAEGRRRLANAGIDRPEVDARRLLAAALGMTPDRIVPHLADRMDAAVQARYLDAIQARGAGRPVSHAVGGRWFRDHWFKVTPDVLDPRPETETLVDLARAVPFDHVLDLGTGTGCVLLSLLAERPAATGVGVDISRAALAVAAGNARDLGLAGRCDFVASDWFSAVRGRFDLIVSNPPYIADAAFESLDRSVRDFEPRQALCPGGDGLDAHRAICRGASGFLTGGGRLIVETGFDQGRAVMALFRDAGLVDVAVHTDMDGRDRVVSGRHRRAAFR